MRARTATGENRLTRNLISVQRRLQPSLKFAHEKMPESPLVSKSYDALGHRRDFQLVPRPHSPTLSDISLTNRTMGESLVSFDSISQPISSPEAAFLLVSTKDANLWDNPYQVPVKNRCDWLLYFTGSVIVTGSFRKAIKQNARVKNMKMSF